MSFIKFRVITKDNQPYDKEGREAFKSGKARADNPYDIFDKRRVSWDIGWINASMGIRPNY